MSDFLAQLGHGDLTASTEGIQETIYFGDRVLTTLAQWLFVWLAETGSEASEPKRAQEEPI